MTTPPISPTDTSDSGAGSASDTKDQAKEAAATASQETQKVAGVATDEARKVAGEAKDHAKGLLDEALTQATDQSRTQLGRLTQTLHSFSDELDEMAGSGSTSGLATDLAREVSTRARDLGTHLEGREPSDLVGDLRAFASRRPGLFLAGALVAGVAAGRLARGAKAAQSSTDTTGTAPSPLPTSAAGVPSQPSLTPTYDATRSAAPVQAVPASPSFLDETVTVSEPARDLP